MKKGSEYQHQKPSVEFWIGYAMGRGINFEVHGKLTEILRTANGMIYGYGVHQEWVQREMPGEISLQQLMDMYGDENNNSD